MRLVWSMGGGHNSAVWCWSLFFLPGTLIHELSHFLVASFTGARTGKVEIFPDFLEDGDDNGTVTLGYVQTQKLNFIQGFLVGVAPFVSGLLILVYLSSLIPLSYLSQNSWLLTFQIYLFFVVANSFFLSWSDVRQTLPLIIISLTTLVVIWLIGTSFNFSFLTTQLQTINTLTITMLLSATLNLIISFLLWLMVKLVRKIKYS